MRSQTNHRAFTLIELLVVIAIIALVIAIVVPTLGGVRDAARSSGTRQILNEVNQAISAFDNDNRRLPGYFDERMMGSTAVNTQGMTSMENLLLDLMGAETSTAAAAPTNGATWIQVGPGTTNGTSRVWLNLDTFGTSSGGTRAYYTPAAKNFIAQTSPIQQIGQPGNTAPEGVAQMPDLIDMWGQPILAWKQDAVTQGQITQADQFAAQSAPSSPNAQGARFYWQSNAAFLNSQALGRRGVDQTTANDKGSLIGGGVSAANLADSLTAFLGHPSFPIRPATGNPTLPAQARGGIVLHSAGSDGVFLGRAERGAKQFAAGGPMLYARSFTNTANQLHTDKNGKTTTIDVIEDFDDEVVAVGN